MKVDETLDELREIRNIMERSGKFLSLSGLSGVAAGVVGILGALYMHFQLGLPWIGELTLNESEYSQYSRINHQMGHWLGFTLAMLILALGAAYYFTMRKARKRGDKLWSAVSRRMLLGMLLPLICGGIISFSLMRMGFYTHLSGITLIFYGLALHAAGNFTLSEIRYLGMIQVVLGLAAFFYTDYSLLFWGLGFGFIHIIYGAALHIKYDR